MEKACRMIKVLMLVLMVSEVMVLPVLGNWSYGGDGVIQCPKGIFVFGDSLADTGNTQAAFPGVPEAILNYPYGISYTFMDKPGRNRYSDGRLVIDFVAQSFGYNFFGTYVHALNREYYVHGANFAYSGAAARADTTITPFYLKLEIDQYIYFKKIYQTPGYPRGLYEPEIDAFTASLYFISEIGGNDITIAAIYNQQSPSQIISTILPQTLAAVRDAIVRLHDSGARFIFLSNLPPQGCLPVFKTILGQFSPQDAQGCLTAYNAIDEAYNAQLNQTVMALQQNYSSDGTKLYLFDWYNATYEILKNPSTYGINNTQQACCGYGPPYNYNPYVGCGNSGAVPTNSSNFVNISSACSTPQTYINWDGVHYTQAFYKETAKMLLTGRFVSPPLNLSQSCGLSFEDFC